MDHRPGPPHHRWDTRSPLLREVKERAIVKLVRSSFIAIVAAAASLAASSAPAQSSYSDVPDKFRIEAGGFRIGADTNLAFNTSGGASQPVDFESLDVPTNATRFYVEGFWRPGRRHELSLSWYSNHR